MAQTLTFAIMDAPFESARTATAFRIIRAAIEKGFNVNVFAYEGAVALTFARQQQHANAVHERDVAAENHPLPRVWVVELQHFAAGRDLQLDWVNCGLCVDERGVGESIPGVRRGTPADLWLMSTTSRNTLVIGTR